MTAKLLTGTLSLNTTNQPRINSENKNNYEGFQNRIETNLFKEKKKKKKKVMQLKRSQNLFVGQNYWKRYLEILKFTFPFSGLESDFLPLTTIHM